MMSAYAQVLGVECSAMAKEAGTRTSRGSCKQYTYIVIICHMFNTIYKPLSGCVCSQGLRNT